MMIIPMGYAAGPIAEGRLLVDGQLPEPIFAWLFVYPVAVMGWNMRYGDRSLGRTVVGLGLTMAVTFAWLQIPRGPLADLTMASFAVCSVVALGALLLRVLFYFVGWVARDPDPWSMFRDMDNGAQEVESEFD